MSTAHNGKITPDLEGESLDRKVLSSERKEIMRLDETTCEIVIIYDQSGWQL